MKCLRQKKVECRLKRGHWLGGGCAAVSQRFHRPAAFLGEVTVPGNGIIFYADPTNTFSLERNPASAFPTRTITDMTRVDTPSDNSPSGRGPCPQGKGRLKSPTSAKEPGGSWETFTVKEIGEGGPKLR